MRLSAHDKERVLACAQAVGLTGKLVRVADRWIVVGTDPEFPRMFVAKAVGEVTPAQVWWTGGWFIEKRRKDAIAAAALALGVGGAESQEEAL